MDDIVPQEIALKQCTTCQQSYPATSTYFHRNKTKSDGFQSQCKTCRSQAKLEVPLLPIPEGHKRCAQCKQTFPATLEFFTNKRQSKDGLNCYCKLCTRAEWKARNPRKVSDVPAGQKRCAKCHQIKPATKRYFSVRTKARDGLHPYCKACTDRTDRHTIPEGFKRCNTCQQILPATSEHFTASKTEKYGLCGTCRICRRIVQRRKYAIEIIQKREHLPEGLKRCTVCQTVYPATLDFFRKSKYGKNGLRADCRLCTQTYERQPHIREKKRCYSKRFQATHKEHIRTKNRNRRARRKSVPGTHTPAQIQEQLKRQHYRCYYAACGHAKFERVKENGQWKYIFQVDHTFPLVRIAGTDIPGNEMSYLVLACPQCNQEKSDKYPWEWAQGGRLL